MEQQVLGPVSMSAMISAIQPVLPNRRRRVRHRIQTPAYASFIVESQAAMLDLHEIVDISEDGVSIQCHSPLDTDQNLNLCLDLAECAEHIYTTGQVIWTSSSGRAGFRFSELSPDSLFKLREWLFLNAMAGVDGAGQTPTPAPYGEQHVPAPPSYTDTLAAVSAVQREVEGLGADLAGALRLIAGRTQILVRASGAAIALSDSLPDTMICRASSGPDAPPVGARLQVGSGFSGECVMTGKLLRCDDAESDPRVDRESCRALGIRSILAVPVRVGEKSIGILEAFSAYPNSFTENDAAVMQRMAETVLAALNRAARAENLPLPGAPARVSFDPTPGSVLFASEPEKTSRPGDDEGKPSSGITLPRSHLYLLIGVAAMIFMALGYMLAPLIQSKILERRGHLQTVLASSQPPRDSQAAAVPAAPSVETATLDQLRQMAEKGDPAAENALGLRYFQGDEKNGIRQDERQAFRWFSSAADHGSLAAQSKLGFLYWSGRGAPKDPNKAYFWTVLARARGDEGNKDLATVLSSGMTRAQSAAIEQQANLWLQQHQAPKPLAGH
jgi:hypothetical protein